MKRFRVFHLLALVALVVTAFGPGVRAVSAAGGGPVFTVNSTENSGDATPGDGLCADMSGACTLRAAIDEANAYPGGNTIQFSLAGSGSHLIFVFSPALPAITEQLVVDGTTQPGCTTPCVVLNGVTLGGSDSGLSLQTDNSTIKGLIITSFPNYGIAIQGNGNIIQGNYIGFWPGVVATSLGNGSGISIVGSTNLIGGTAAGQRNVISGNLGQGITVQGNGNTIQGNYIGTNAAGTAALGNAGDGIDVSAAALNTVIGGTAARAGNVISGNLWTGVALFGNDTVVQGNLIGTKANGKGALGNGEYGIMFSMSAANNLIGGPVNAARNKIAYNGLGGILVYWAAPGPNTIRHNWLFRNGGLGIDLGNDGVTPNDALDADTGPNGLQNYPVLTAAYSTTQGISGKLPSQPNSTYIVEFFSSPVGTCDPSVHGEGAKFIGSKSVTTDATGLAKFKFVSAVPFAAGSVITATATDGSGNTSEFSACRTAG